MATFTGLDPYKLTGVRVTDRKLGHGSYATVLELEYMGLKCAGKKIHELLLEQGDTCYTVCRFEEECHLLSQVHHPNIVQFLGVYFQQGVQAPILVMEFLPTNLSSCIDQYGILPKEISYSILHDVALGLCYLHRQTSPIIHRDLSSNNVLLNPNMTAKISDLGVARILNLTPLQVSHMTQTPGTPTYMPPEVMLANPKYDTSVDEFSYGILMIHIFSGKWPEPQVGPNRTEPDGSIIPVSEAERRKVFLQAIGNDHPLMELILKCIYNHPQARAHASEIAKRLSEMVLQFPACYANRLEMLRQIEADKEEKRMLEKEGERKDRLIQESKEQILVYQEKLHAKEQQKIAEIGQLKVAHCSEIEELHVQVRDLNTQNKLVNVEKDLKIMELNHKLKAVENQVENNGKILLEEREQFAIQLTEEREQCKMQLRKEREQNKIQLEKEREQFIKEREANKKLMANTHDLQAELSKYRSQMTTLQSTISKLRCDIIEKNTSIQMKDASAKIKDSEIAAKSKALEEKNATITAISKQLNKARGYLASNKQVPQACIMWKQCTELPITFHVGNTTVISGKVYCGGGETNDDNDKYTVHCYDPSLDKWTTLPPLPVKYFGLGQVNGKLVAVGGEKRSSLTPGPTNEIYTYSERSQKWRHTIPPMPTARHSIGVLSLQSALVVAGGDRTLWTYLAAVEIFKLDTSQWYRTDPLPTACCNISLISIGNTCYALGGYKDSYLNQTLFASVDDLLGNAVPANQTTHSSSSDTYDQSAWKTLPNTPTYQPATAVLAGSLLAVGGKERSEGEDDMKEVYVYSPSTNSWVYISDLPAPRSSTAVAILSSNKVLVMGGWDGDANVKTVYKGTFTCTISL